MLSYSIAITDLNDKFYIATNETIKKIGTNSVIINPKWENWKPNEIKGFISNLIKLLSKYF